SSQQRLGLVKGADHFFNVWLLELDILEAVTAANLIEHVNERDGFVFEQEMLGRTVIGGQRRCCKGDGAGIGGEFERQAAARSKRRAQVLQFAVEQELAVVYHDEAGADFLDVDQIVGRENDRRASLAVDLGQ